MRSLLFAGATRPDLVAKLARSGPDAVAIDLEDAVPADAKLEARAALGEGAALVAGLESARGVAEAGPICEAGPEAAYFGAEDYIADLGGRRTAGGEEVLFARSQVALAARLAGVPTLDQVVVDFRDEGAFERDAEAGRAIGYRGKLCIHPSQVTIANRVFGASAAEVGRARGLLAAWEEGAARGVAAVDFEGAMVDGPALRMARDTIERAGES
jgi:citrate lyase subunit beta / citryl-CoA lyase